MLSNVTQFVSLSNMSIFVTKSMEKRVEWLKSVVSTKRMKFKLINSLYDTYISHDRLPPMKNDKLSKVFKHDNYTLIMTNQNT